MSKQAVDDIRDFVEKTNKNLLNKGIYPDNIECYFVLKTGLKRKKISLYYHEVFRKSNGNPIPSRFNSVFQKFVETKEDLEKVAKQYPNAMWEMLVTELSEKDMSKVPRYKILYMGRHKYKTVDELVHIDPDYCAWLIKQALQKSEDENLWSMNRQDEYLISEEYRTLLKEAINQKIKENGEEIETKAKKYKPNKK